MVACWCACLTHTFNFNFGVTIWWCMILYVIKAHTHTHTHQAWFRHATWCMIANRCMWSYAVCFSRRQLVPFFSTISILNILTNNHESRLTLLSKCSKWRLSKKRGLVAYGWCALYKLEPSVMYRSETSTESPFGSIRPLCHPLRTVTWRWFVPMPTRIRRMLIK